MGECQSGSLAEHKMIDAVLCTCVLEPNTKTDVPRRNERTGVLQIRRWTDRQHPGSVDDAASSPDTIELRESVTIAAGIEGILTCSLVHFVISHQTRQQGRYGRSGIANRLQHADHSPLIPHG